MFSAGVKLKKYFPGFYGMNDSQGRGGRGQLLGYELTMEFDIVRCIPLKGIIPLLGHNVDICVTHNREHFESILNSIVMTLRDPIKIKM